VAQVRATLTTDRPVRSDQSCSAAETPNVQAGWAGEHSGEGEAPMGSESEGNKIVVAGAGAPAPTLSASIRPILQAKVATAAAADALKCQQDHRPAAETGHHHDREHQ
jgi:hypothetical protein